MEEAQATCQSASSGTGHAIFVTICCFVTLSPLTASDSGLRPLPSPMHMYKYIYIPLHALLLPYPCMDAWSPGKSNLSNPSPACCWRRCKKFVDDENGLGARPPEPRAMRTPPPPPPPRRARSRLGRGNVPPWALACLSIEG
jgi:hypothetical protein